MSHVEQSPSQGPGTSGLPDLDNIDVDDLTDEQVESLLDPVFGTEEGGDPLDTFKQELAQQWDDLTAEEQAAILQDYPELLGGQG